MANIYSELRRRRVFATVSIYIVAAWLLIQVADVLFPGWNIAEENIRYLVYAAVACFPIACIVGWKYDITTHGIRRTPPASQVPDETSLPLNRADHAILSFLSLATITIVVGFSGNIERNQVLEADYVLPNSVAVLPFANLSEEADNEYFSTGLWQEMINVMGQIDGFRVTPAASAGYFRGRDLDLTDIKQKLQVANVIIGSVQKVANRVRITLSLSDTGEGANLWSQTYDRSLEDIFAIQSDIAHAVAEVMKVQILGTEEERLETPPTSSVEAYDLLMLANDADNFRRSIELTDRALELDPAYVDALLGKALTVIGTWYRPGGGGVEAALELCKSTKAKVLELTPDAADTSYLYNWVNGICLRRILFMGRGNPDIEREMEAFELNQRAIEYFDEGYDQLANRYADLGRFDRAVETLLQAPSREGQNWGGRGNRRLLIYSLMALRDPESADKYRRKEGRELTGGDDELGAARGKAWDLAANGKYNEAYEMLVAATDKAGTTEWFILNEPAELALLAGRWEDAIRIFDIALPVLADPIRPDVQKNNVVAALQLAHALQMEGSTARAGVLFGRILDQIEGRRRVGFEGIGNIDACIYASLGETDKALAAMREAVDAGWRDFYGGMLNQPPVMLNSLVGIPEYDAMVAEINADLAVQLERVKAMYL